MSVAVVTDSTAHLPEGFAERHAVRVVPLHVLVDGVVSLDGVETGPAAVAEAMSQRKIVTTSRPTPTEFVKEYRAALAEGADAVVSVHLSSELSGTWEAAVLAAKEVGPDRVSVVDSTNDTVVVLASGSSGVRVDQAQLSEALTAVSASLARQLVADALEQL